MSHETTHKSPIAVVGLGAMFPGRGTTVGYWQDILESRDTTGDVPKTHWRPEDYYDEDPSAADKTYSRRGAFIPSFAFDPIEFGTPPNVVETTDTVQLMALYVAKRVLAEATRGSYSEIDKERTSVILGVAAGTELIGDMASRLNRPIWLKAMREGGLPEEEAIRIADNISSHFTEWRESTFPGLLGNVVAGRIANRLDLHGTNFTADAACASSLAAIKHGMQELWLGESDLVLTGGADALNNIFMYMCFSKTPAMSPTGLCRPFSEDADGTLMGEGCGILGLRRLEDAERDGNPIYAVIKGIGTSSDGSGTSVYAPRASGQALALQRAYDMAGYSPRTVGLVEAHGTGTRAGDAAEFGGLCEVFDVESDDQQTGEATQWCALGSVKSQIGHTKSAAGAAGIIKAILALHHKVLPPTLHISQPNPKLPFANSPFYLNTAPRPWVRTSDDSPRRASVSSFGFGGSNFHVTLEEYQGDGTRPDKFRSMPAELFLFSANSSIALTAAVDARLEAMIDDADLAHHAREAAATFEASGKYRLAIVATSISDIRDKVEKLTPLLKKETDVSTPDIVLRIGEPESGKVAFLFSGQGSQYPGMGADLAMTFDCARAEWERANRIASGDEAALTDIVFQRGFESDEAAALRADQLTATQNAQPAIAAVALSQLAILDRLGVKPVTAAGHSFGEIMALHAAGVFDSDAAVELARQRGQAMASASEGTDAGMLAAMASKDAVAAALCTQRIDIVIANDNSSNQVILSGEASAIDAAADCLKTRGIKTKRLPVSTAFHSPIVAGAAIAMADALKTKNLTGPAIPVYANATAQPYSVDVDQIRRTLSEQITKQVRFRETIQAMYAGGVRVFVEVGPSAVLSQLVGQNLGDKKHLVVSLDDGREHGVRSLLRAVAKLAAAGISVDLDCLWMEAPPAEPLPAPKKHALFLNGANYGKPYPPLNEASPCQSRREAPVGVDNQVAAPSGTAPEPSIDTTVIDVSHVLKPKNGTATNLRADAPAVDTPSADSTDAADLVREIVSEKTGYPVEMLEAGMDLEGELGIDSIKQVEILSSLRERLPSMPEIEPSRLAELRTLAQIATAIGGASVAPAEQTERHPAPTLEPVDTRIEEAEVAVSEDAPHSNVTASDALVSSAADLVREVVAEKTGYPAEMLEAQMDLEAELGIDSIKQVEILSSLRERLPSMPEIEPSRLAELRTLAQIASAIDTETPIASVAVQLDPIETVEIRDMQEVAEPSDSVTVTAVTTAPAAEAVDLVREIVAEKTGYPVEMLEARMDLEAELGIDSIKQVEILSSLRERLPSMPEIEPSRLAELRTLAQIATAIDVGTPGVAPTDHEASIQAVDTSGRVDPVEPANPTAVSAAATAPVTEAVDLVREIVAEKTGYPVEMLEARMDLEAELGIDSIKQVEILSSLRERLPSMPEIEPSRLAELRTLAQIATAIGGATTPETLDTEIEFEAEAQIEAAEDLSRVVEIESFRVDRELDRAADLGLYRQQVVLTRRRSAGTLCRWAQEGGRVAVTNCAEAVARVLVEMFEARGIEASAMDPDQVGGYECVVVTSGLSDSLTNEEVHLRALQAARTVAADFTETGGAFITLQDTGGQFGRTLNEVYGACSGGLTGLVKTAGHEWPAADVKAIDIDRHGVGSVGDETDPMVAFRIVDEILTGGDDVEVGLIADDQRLVPAVEIAGDLPPDGRHTLENGSVVLVSGGGRGVTARAIIELAGTRHLRFALLGRTKLVSIPNGISPSATEAEIRGVIAQEAMAAGEHTSPRDVAAKAKSIIATREVLDTMAAIERAGSEVVYQAVDVTDPAAVLHCCSQIRRRWGPISAIVHGAGVLADKLIKDKTDEQLIQVFSTKVAGLQALLAGCANDPLKVVALFSSIAGRYGNPGQADYAMANEALNRAAWAIRNVRGDCKVVSINWGPWEGGMVDEGVRRQFEARGIPIIPTDVGSAAFVREVQEGAEECVELVFAGRTDAPSSTSAEAL